MPIYTLAALADRLGAKLYAPDDNTEVSSVAPLNTAARGQLTFLGLAKYKSLLAHTEAEVVLLTEEDRAQCPVACLVVDNPSAKFAEIAKLFARRVNQAPGIASTAVVGENCGIAESASIGARCVLGDRVQIGKGSVVLPGTVIGDDVVIGENCIFHANVTLYRASQIGNQVTVHSGAVIGCDGFGNANEGGQWKKIPQLGRVIIHDHVEIGSNTTIDCGALGDTIIGEGVKLDNQIQIAHNVEIGAHTAMAAQCGVAGSVKIGKYCMFGGKVGINGHVTICDHVIVTASSGIMKSISKPGIYSSSMAAMEHNIWNKNFVRIRRLDEFCRRLMKLEKRVKEEEAIL